MKNNKNQNNRRIVSVGQIVGWIAVFILAVLLFNKPGVKQTELDYSEFKHKVASSEVSDLTIAPGVISGMYKNEKGEFAPFKTVRMDDPELVSQLSAADIHAPLVWGFVSAFAGALAVIGWLMKYIKTHSFDIFVYYRWLLGAAIIVFYFCK